jgi:hypothetical protein
VSLVVFLSVGNRLVRKVRAVRKPDVFGWLIDSTTAIVFQEKKLAISNT